jgi:hypothetical protein
LKLYEVWCVELGGECWMGIQCGRGVVELGFVIDVQLREVVLN